MTWDRYLVTYRDAKHHTCESWVRIASTSTDHAADARRCIVGNHCTVSEILSVVAFPTTRDLRNRQTEEDA